MQVTMGGTPAENGFSRPELTVSKNAQLRPVGPAESFITAQRRFPALSVLFRFCLFLCLALATLLVTATRSEAAPSNACQEINADLGGTVNLDTNNLLQGQEYADPQDKFYENFNAGERVEWNIEITGVSGNVTRTSYNISTSDFAEALASGDTTLDGNKSESGSRVLLMETPDYILLQSPSGLMTLRTKANALG